MYKKDIRKMFNHRSENYDGPSVKEQIKNLFFSRSFFCWRESKKNFYFHSRLLVRWNKFKFNFTPFYWEEKINLDLFSLPFIGERK